MKLPHVLIYNSPLPHFFGRLVGRPTFFAWTVFCFTFVDDEGIAEHQRLHEYRHVWQFFAVWSGALVAAVVLQPAWWLWFLTPLVFSAVYLLAGVIAVLRGEAFYRANWFEVDARRYAGEPE